MLKPRKEKESRRKKNKMMENKGLKKFDCGYEILRNKHLINNVETEKEEKCLAVSGATTHVTNTK